MEDVRSDLSRRGFIAGAGVAALAAVGASLAGCGKSEQPTPASQDGADAKPEADAAEAKKSIPEVFTDGV